MRRYNGCMETVKRNIGVLITGWRKSASLSQAALAEAIGANQATVSKLEKGVNRLTVEQLLAILDACGLSLAEVADDVSNTVGREGKPIWERVDE